MKKHIVAAIAALAFALGCYRFARSAAVARLRRGGPNHRVNVPSANSPAVRVATPLAKSTSVTRSSGPSHRDATRRTASPDGFVASPAKGSNPVSSTVVTSSAYEPCASVLIPRPAAANPARNPPSLRHP